MVGFSSFLPFFVFSSFSLFLGSSLLPLLVYPQQIWLIHQRTDEPLLNALVRGTTLCGIISHHSQHRGRRSDPRPEVPPAPRLRKVLAIVDLQSVRPLMTKTHDDVMDATTCDVTPSLSRVEERALFTYNVLLNTHRLESFTVYNLLYCISQHSGTPGITTCPRLPWTSDGKTKLETHLLSATKTDLLISFMISGLSGSKVKNVA